MLPTGPSFQRTCQIEDDGWLSPRLGSFLSTEGMLGVAAPFTTNGSKAASCAADKMAIKTANLGPTQVRPTYYVLTIEQLPWLEIADDLPRYECGSRDATPVSNGPRGGL